VGFVALAGFLLVFYWHGLGSPGRPAVAAEMAAQIAQPPVAIALVLELKMGLKALTKRVAPEEIFTFTNFLLLAAVILPALPNAAFGPLHINPFTPLTPLVATSASILMPRLGLSPLFWHAA
jgi:uncharacterized membrane protein (DUF4010 family)